MSWCIRLQNFMSAFINLDDEKVYLVKGLNSTWSEMLDGMPPPVLLNTTLLPWKDVIISDGLVALTPVYFGKGYSTEFKEIYMNAKHNSTIFNSL